MCIRNNGIIMKSRTYDLGWKGDLRSVYNFLLGMLITAAESSPNTSPTKPGPKQDEEIRNFDRDIFVRVFEDEVLFDIPAPPPCDDEDVIVGDDWSDIELPEEE